MLRFLTAMSLSCLTSFASQTQGNQETLGFEEYPVEPGKFDFFYENPFGLGWQTTAPNGRIEVWGSGFMGIDAYEGIRFTELNTYSIYHDVLLSPLDSTSMSFSHRARVNLDLVRLDILDIDRNLSILSRNFDAVGDWWHTHTLNLPENTGNLRIKFTPIPTGGSNSGGNYIDSIKFGNSVPSPSSVAILATAFLVLPKRKSRR